MATNLLIVWPENRTVYANVRGQDGNVWNPLAAKPESYNEENISRYKLPLVYKGGDIYLLVLTKIPFVCAIVYEQKGKKPDKYDKVIGVFGKEDVVHFNSDLFPEKHRPYEPAPPRPRNTFGTKKITR